MDTYVIYIYISLLLQRFRRGDTSQILPSKVWAEIVVVQNTVWTIAAILSLHQATLDYFDIGVFRLQMELRLLELLLRLPEIRREELKSSLVNEFAEEIAKSADNKCILRNASTVEKCI